FADPQVAHLGMARPVTHPRLGRIELVGSAISLSGVPKEIRSPTPEAGQHTEEVLREAGFSDAEITGMRAKGAI
ncbi:MAG: CoA transferase, partial [Acetobacteraceae bacterium]